LKRGRSEEIPPAFVKEVGLGGCAASSKGGAAAPVGKLTFLPETTHP
jgi:hypothetical protein